MAQKEQSVKTPTPLKTVNSTAVLRTVWVLLALVVLGLVITAVPYRMQMLVEDDYGFGQFLAEVGLSLSFFAAYFVFWELVVITGSLLVAVVIVWRRADDPFAMLVAISLTLFGLLPPLVDGLSLLNPQFTGLVVVLRGAEMVCMMAVICLFPNGRFQPGWTRWWFVGWLVALTVAHLIKPDVLAEAAALPNIGSLSDAVFCACSPHVWRFRPFARRTYTFIQIVVDAESRHCPTAVLERQNGGQLHVQHSK
jgi:hypothetical protein